MIRTVQAENYKSIPNLRLELGRVTVLIGANGSGKSNILEVLALASAAAQNKLDNEFLISRGIRVTETRFMRSAFDEAFALGEKIKITVAGEKGPAFVCHLFPDETASYPKWKQDLSLPLREIMRYLSDVPQSSPPHDLTKIENVLLARPYLVEQLVTGVARESRANLPQFLIYAPENSALRTFQVEGQILPLGIRGEGLFAHLKALNTRTHREHLEKIKEQLQLIEWFDSFDIPDDLAFGERSIRIRDRYLPDGALFDQRSANEGFLFLLFYITLLISPDTPSFFSIDNIDSSLNPKLCIELVQRLTELAKERDKQVILTTHNPAVLDGLDLHDDEQRLLVVDRNKEGHTRIRRVEPPKPSAGQPPVSLSEAFMRGYIGGLPKNF